MKLVKTIFAAIALSCAVTLTGYAGGPLSTFNNLPVRYRTTQPIVYHVDKGSMGAFTNAVARNLAVTSFQVWEDVALAVIAFQLDSMSVDVNGSNYTTYLSNNSDGLNPIVFDNDGSIIDGLLGEGSSSNVIGFAGSSYFTSGVNAGFYAEGRAVMNGTMAGVQFSEAEFKSTFVHEFGHFIGLDHSQVNASFAANGNGPDDQYLPTMYPTSSDDDTQMATLNADDIASVSRIYPAASFASSTATISGSVTRQDGAFVRGAVVVAINVADSLATQFSTVTDYLQQGTGSYSITGLTPGTYWIKLEPVRAAFTGGSSVGPYADDLSGLSFLNPVLVEYYNGANESWDPSIDTASRRVTVTVGAGASAAADFVANGEAASLASILENFGNPSFVFELPSDVGDLKYAVRFTPGVTAPLQKVSFLMNAGADAINGTGTLRVGVFSHKAGSIGGIPNLQLGTYVTKPFTALTAGTYNEVDLTPLNLTMTSGVNFHVTFDLIGTSGDTLQFITDDGASPTSRSSSYYDAGSGATWYNFQDPLNYGDGYNLVVRAYLSTTGVGGEQEIVLLPDGFALKQNYPNPFNPSTTIPFDLEQGGRITLTVVDMLGRVVATLVDGEEYSAGSHLVTFDARNLASGAYMAHMSYVGHRKLVRMLLLK